MVAPKVNSLDRFINVTALGRMMNPFCVLEKDTLGFTNLIGTISDMYLSMNLMTLIIYIIRDICCVDAPNNI